MRCMLAPCCVHVGAVWASAVWTACLQDMLLFGTTRVCLDSHQVPEAEYEETVNKAAALGRAIDLAEQAFLGASPEQQAKHDHL